MINGSLYTGRHHPLLLKTDLKAMKQDLQTNTIDQSDDTTGPEIWNLSWEQWKVGTISDGGGLQQTNQQHYYSIIAHHVQTSLIAFSVAVLVGSNFFFHEDRKILSLLQGLQFWGRSAVTFHRCSSERLTFSILQTGDVAWHPPKWILKIELSRGRLLVPPFKKLENHCVGIILKKRRTKNKIILWTFNRHKKNALLLLYWHGSSSKAKLINLCASWPLNY